MNTKSTILIDSGSINDLLNKSSYDLTKSHYMDVSTLFFIIIFNCSIDFETKSFYFQLDYTEIDCQNQDGCTTLQSGNVFDMGQIVENFFSNLFTYLLNSICRYLCSNCLVQVEKKF